MGWAFEWINSNVTDEVVYEESPSPVGKGHAMRRSSRDVIESLFSLISEAQVIFESEPSSSLNKVNINCEMVLIYHTFA